ncbi:hypothetical protein [Nocardioides sp. NPDC004968]|uniref:hypothetical protein n=1 Tax=Nocardioides sp. NPDC004968 TaxID=3155894 RepID=UPI0033B18705
MICRSAPATVLLALVFLIAGPAVGPAAGAAMPPNPYAGPDGTWNMHGDAGASDTTPFEGPGAAPFPAQAVPLPAVCPTILSGADGMVQALCTEYIDRAPSLYLLDPTTLLPVARRHLSAGSLLGGVYAYVDNESRLVTVDGSGSLLWLAHSRPGLRWSIDVEREVPVNLPEGDAVTTVGPGYDANVWFATAQGRAGYVTPDGDIVIATLGAGDEKVANSISSAPSGVAVTTDHATYLLRADGDGDAVRTVWRQPYDRGEARKPGQLSHGSGSTPTFFGKRTGAEFVVITDNAAPRENLLVYRARDGREICRLPILTDESSGTENSPVAWGNSVYIASTYGYPYPAQATEDAGESVPAKADFAGGMERIDVDERSGACASVWRNEVPSAAVPRLSRGENVLYTVTRRGSGLTWRLARIDPADGQILSETFLGLGPLANTLQMVGTILPDGTLLQGTLAGLVAVRR